MHSPDKMTKKEFMEAAGSLALSSHIFSCMAGGQSLKGPNTEAWTQHLKRIRQRAFLSASFLKDSSYQGPDASVRH